MTRKILHGKEKKKKIIIIQKKTKTKKKKHIYIQIYSECLYR